ncbi:hypothetical protein GMLC_17320 [Geomonas limicola]|uniref:DUF2339 domain-containing protein n=1 Tax=Geomonas limicola TaxID=2740186 RepID=A0A6V8N9F9_9BACT|nr:hypothetical protein [Geomonas limicola]GFO68153.1 hypothetical protein GMLC_17320 [Geomonas limicola]
MARDPEQAARIEQLGSELSALSARVAQLELLLSASGQGVPTPAAAAEPAPAWRSYPDQADEDVSEEILDWAGKAHLLTRVSTLCFLLVLALVLRTLTDNRMIDTLLGSVLGMGYAAALMAIGAWRYHVKSPLAPIFAASGAILMSTIVVETHSRFASLPLVPAYLTLIATGGAMAWVSYRYQRFLPISLGTLGMCLAGAAIDYPHPFFPYLSLVLFAANILGYFAAQLKSCSWLRWIVLAVTLAMLQLWTVRLGMLQVNHQTVPADLAAGWILPTLAAFALLFLLLALTGILLPGPGRVSRFNLALPTLNTVWLFAAAGYLVHSSGGNTRVLGQVGTVLALGLLGLSVWLAGRREKGAPGSSAFALAGAALAALALPFAFGKFTLSLPALSVIAFSLAFMSREWQNGGIRACAYLIQIYASLALAIYLQLHGDAAGDVVNTVPAGLIALIALYQYQWCRQWPPPSSSVFERFDAGDLSAVSLLLCALASAFFMAKAGIFQLIAMAVPAAEFSNTFGCSQSIIINGSAALLMGFAYLKRNKELRNVAVLVTLIGAVKVFVYDLFGAHGVPLVASVFTFGLAAALESVALGRWQKHRETPAALPSDSAARPAA